VIKAIRGRSKLPITVFPFLGATTLKVGDVRQRALDFKNATGIDIQIWQDSVATQATNLGWNSASPTVGEYYAAISKAIGATGFWDDAEIYAWRQQRAALLSQVLRQIEQASPHVSQTVVYLNQQYMSAVFPRPGRALEAPRLLAAYRAHVGIAGRVIKPSTYTWMSAPDTQHADSQNTKLFDDFAANPRDSADPRWVGVSGPATVQLDLGDTQRVDWVAVHWVHSAADSIYFPTSLKISSWNDGQFWNPTGEWLLAGFNVKNTNDTSADGEHVFSSDKPLGIDAQFIRVELPNSGRTFWSEVEIVGL